jgi:predicted TIM-barrel fold metal-dependent hydrolase
MADFAGIKKIDAHVHDNCEGNAFTGVAARNGFRLLSINVDYPDFPPLEDQARCAQQHLQDHPEVFAYASSFSMGGWDGPDWADATIAHLDSTFARGAAAVKFWKNIGMVFRDTSEALVMINDRKFDRILEHLVKKDVAVVFHCGEPRDCWLPVEKMMSNDMKEYFSKHPQYHMNLHPEMPSYEAQIAARDAMLERNPRLKFIGAHIGSLEWSVDELQKFLDRYPAATVDLAARMDYVQIQSQRDPNKVYRFFDTYRDRILYGSDMIMNPLDDSTSIAEQIRAKWLADWAYLATDSTLTPANVPGSVKGLGLPKDVIDKIYCGNAERMLGQIWQR